VEVKGRVPLIRRFAGSNGFAVSFKRFSVPEKLRNDFAVLLARGDASAFGEIVAAYKDRLVNYFHRTLGDPHTAEDLAQEVFIRVLRHCESFRDGMPFEPWLFSIARNLAVDQVRKTGRKTVAGPYSETESANEDPSRALERREVGDLVRNEIRKLPEKLRDVVVLCELEGFSYETAGGILGIPSKTVGSRLAKARATLREKLKNYIFRE
jgi:RNA polymerase sigma-70 factor (ECF subfamily)